MHEKELIRGALVNMVGVLAKLINPLFFVLVTWMFGTEVMGVYFLATFMMQVVIGAVAAGYNQGVIIFASPHADDAESDELYQVLANSFAVTLGMSALLVPAGLLLIDPLIAAFYSDRPELGSALKVLVWSLPLAALAPVAIAATKAKMIMEYDTAINGFCRPIALLAFAVVAWWLKLGLLGLMWAHVATHALSAALALWGFGRHYSIWRTLASFPRLRLHRELLSFSVPQSMNMTFNRYLTRLDVIMLGAFGFSNRLVAFYAAASLITSSLRELKLALSTALAPIVARAHATLDIEGLEAALGRVSRWTVTAVIPLSVLVLALRRDLVLLVDRGFTGDTTFMLVLLIPPLLSSAFGLAGNFIVYTRHSRWNLFNSLLVAGLNTLFNLALIPRYGLMGAALATAAAATVTVVAQIIELGLLEHVWLRMRFLHKPLLGLAAVTGVLVALGDPAGVASLALRIVAGLGLASGFVVLMALLKHEEVLATWRRLRALPKRIRAS